MLKAGAATPAKAVRSALEWHAATASNPSHILHAQCNCLTCTHMLQRGQHLPSAYVPCLLTQMLDSALALHAAAASTPPTHRRSTAAASPVRACCSVGSTLFSKNVMLKAGTVTSTQAMKRRAVGCR